MVMTDFYLPDNMKLRPSHRPVIRESEFRAAMASMAATVHVVTACQNGERSGRTVTALLSLSASPPTILVSIDVMSRLANIIASSNRFSVAMLTDDQQDIADAFAGYVPPEHRFAIGNWNQWPSGNPMLQGAMTALDCEVIGSIATGTHILFAGGIVETATTVNHRPLLWQHRHYGTLSRLD